MAAEISHCLTVAGKLRRFYRGERTRLVSGSGLGPRAL